MTREVIARRVIGVTSHAAGLCTKYRAIQSAGANNPMTAFGGKGDNEEESRQKEMKQGNWGWG